MTIVSSKYYRFEINWKKSRSQEKKSSNFCTVLPYKILILFQKLEEFQITLTLPLNVFLELLKQNICTGVQYKTNRNSEILLG